MTVTTQTETRYESIKQDESYFKANLVGQWGWGGVGEANEDI